LRSERRKIIARPGLPFDKNKAEFYDCRPSFVQLSQTLQQEVDEDRAQIGALMNISWREQQCRQES
jgi:hypothetical protein